MKKILTPFFILLLTHLFAQEFRLPIENQYLADNDFIVSDSYAGIGDCWQARSSGFQQWVGVKNAPSTQTLSFDGRIQDRSGIGGIFFLDANGATKQRGVQLSFSHHLTLDAYRQRYLSFGISYKYTQFSIDTADFNEPSLIGIDDQSTVDHNFNVSTLLRFRSFFVNLNVINLLEKKLLDFSSGEPESITSYYLYTGYTFKNEIKATEIQPSLLYRSFQADGRSTIDANVKFKKFKKKNYYWGGMSIRTLIDQGFMPLSASPMIGMRRNSLYFSYGYQFNLNETTQFTQQGSHMLTIGIDFLCKKSSCGCTY